MCSSVQPCCRRSLTRSLPVTKGQYSPGVVRGKELRDEAGLGVEPAGERGTAEAIVVGRLPEPELAVPRRDATGGAYCSAATRAHGALGVRPTAPRTAGV